MAALLAALWLVLYSTADHHWLGTLLAFGPRWMLLVPVGVLLPTAALWRRRALVPLAVSVLIVLGPMMGLRVPWRTWVSGAVNGPELRVLTLNTDGVADPRRVCALIEATQPSVVALQECGACERWIQLFDSTWHVRAHGELLVASRFPILEAAAIESAALPPWRSPALRCRLASPAGILDFVNIHLYTPRDGLAAVMHGRCAGIAELQVNTERRRTESEAVANWLEQAAAPTIVAGDFNETVESCIYRDCFSRYRNAFSDAGLGWGATYYSRWHGLRIDHILTDDEWRRRNCWVGPDVGSAHRPLLAVLAFPKKAERIAHGGG